MRKVFDETISILKNSLDSVDENQFNKLLDECEKTLRGGQKLLSLD